jgi:hypothetical protein
MMGFCYIVIYFHIDMNRVNYRDPTRDNGFNKNSLTELQVMNSIVTFPV